MCGRRRKGIHRDSMPDPNLGLILPSFFTKITLQILQIHQWILYSLEKTNSSRLKPTKNFVEMFVDVVLYVYSIYLVALFCVKSVNCVWSMSHIRNSMKVNRICISFLLPFGPNMLTPHDHLPLVEFLYLFTIQSQRHPFDITEGCDPLLLIQWFNSLHEFLLMK